MSGFSATIFFNVEMVKEECMVALEIVFPLKSEVFTLVLPMSMVKFMLKTLPNLLNTKQVTII
jgi:hypothetical protein